jgi:hypothetical protein
MSIIGIGCIKSVDMNNRANYWYRLLKWAVTKYIFFIIILFYNLY